MASTPEKTEPARAAPPELFDRGVLKWAPFPSKSEPGPETPPSGALRSYALVRTLPLGPARDVLESTGHAVRSAMAQGRARIWAVGAGLRLSGAAPAVVEAVDRGMVSCLCLDGDAARCDVEHALFGTALAPWQERCAGAGLWRDTAAVWADAVRRARGRRLGLGMALGETLVKRDAPFAAGSLLAACASRGVPATLHFTPGTLGIELFPDLTGAELGEAAMRDLRLLLQVAMKLDGGVWIHLAGFMPLGRLLCQALGVLNNLDSSPPRLTVTCAGEEAAATVNEELRAALAAETHPDRNVRALVAAFDLVAPLLTASVVREPTMPDMYRDI